MSRLNAPLQVAYPGRLSNPCEPETHVISLLYESLVNYRVPANTAIPAAYLPISPQPISGQAVLKPLQSEPIRRAADSTPTPIQDMGVDHRRAHVLVSKKLLNRPNIVTIFEKVYC